MKFLIDECLTPDLDCLAHAAGFEASSVRNLGRLSSKDWHVAPYAIENDYILVTRNSRDFRGGNGKPGYLTRESLHPGLICLNATAMHGELQRMLFQAALDFLLAEGIIDLLNHVLEIDHVDGTSDEAEVRLYEAPPSA